MSDETVAKLTDVCTSVISLGAALSVKRGWFGKAKLSDEQIGWCAGFGAFGRYMLAGGNAFVDWAKSGKAPLLRL